VDKSTMKYPICKTETQPCLVTTAEVTSQVGEGTIPIIPGES